MSEFINSFIKKSKPQFAKYKKYILNNDWSNLKTDENLSEELFVDYIDKEHTNKKIIKSEIAKYVKEKLKAEKDNISYKSDEFKLQNDLAKNILSRLQFFAKKAEGDHHKIEFKKFVKFCLEVIDTHTQRTDDYINSVDISTIKNQDIRAEEMKFLKECFAGITSINDGITALNIKDDESQGEGLTFHDNKKAPLAMHSILSEQYPEIGRRLEAMGIDFISPPNNELLIYTENVPEWNPEKHYWEQEIPVLRFYVDEMKKILNGIIIDGHYISGWEYYHINVFTTSYPIDVANPITGEVETVNKIGVPPYRDNESWVMENYTKAKKDGKMLFLAASRRAAKTTMLASHLDWCVTIGKLNLLCVGGSTKDLDQIEANFKITSLKKNPAFKVYNINDDWSKKIELGIKKKDGKNLVSSVLHIINLNKGGEKASEILAGYTPDAVIIDEIMKLPFIDQLAALKPALDSPGGKRCVVILSGTAGNEELAKDAFTVLSDPEANEILEMQWDLINSRVPIEYRTWTERKFGTFIPAQMSAKKGLIKRDSNLADYLKITHSENLRKIKIKVTDWEHAKKVIEQAREKVKKDHKLLTKEILYHPIDPEEMLMTSKINPFPREEAIKRKQYLIETGLWDRRRTIYKDNNGALCSEISTLPLAPWPHRGGTVEAPIQIFEDIPLQKPVDNLYIASFDDVKQDDSETDSLISFNIWKMETFADEWAGRQVLSWVCRPADRKAMYKKWLMLQEAYNAKAFPENEDMGYKTFLETLHLEDKWLSLSVDFTASMNIINTEKRKYGWMPRRDKKILLDLFIDKMDNKKIIGESEDGEEIWIKEVQLIDDIGLLDEIIDYKEGLNVDRISSALGAVGWMHYLNINYIRPKKIDIEDENKPIRHFQKKIFGSSGYRKAKR